MKTQPISRKISVLLFSPILAMLLLKVALSVAQEVTTTSKGEIAIISGVLDGKIFNGPRGEKGKEADGEDQLSFRNGKLHSANCVEWGFGDGVYTATAEGDDVHFKAEIFSDKHGKIVWKGTVRGDILDATYTWSKEGWFRKTVQDYWFKGVLNR